MFLQGLLGGLEIILVDMLVHAKDSSLQFTFHTLIPFINSLFSDSVIPICLGCLFGFCCLLYESEFQSSCAYLRLCLLQVLVPRVGCACSKPQVSALVFSSVCFLLERETSMIVKVWKQVACLVANKITGL